ncbi:MAG: LamG domain-containing protein, partial [Acetivibrionales bacterium]
MISPNKKPPEIETKTLRLADFSMGLNTTISGSLLNNNELQVAEDVSFEQKGTIMPRRGRRKRYEEEFSDSPCCGLGSYYKKDGTTKLLFAAGDKLYSDSPSISVKWDNQNDWEETNSKQVNLDSSTTPGDIQIKESTQTVLTFTRDSVAYLEDGTQVASGVPRFEDGKFGKGVLIEEGTTNVFSYPTFNTADSSGGWNHWGQIGSIGAWGQNTDPSFIFGNQTYSHWVENAAGATGDYLIHQAPSLDGQPGYSSIIFVCCMADGSPVTNGKCYPGWNGRDGGAPNNQWTSIKQIGTSKFYECRVDGIHQDGTNDLIGVYIKPGNKVYFSRAQCERKPYATSFVDGTRAAETLTIPTAGVLSPQEGTWGLWVYIDSTARRQVANQWPTIFRIPGVSSVGIFLYHDTDTATWELQTQNDVGTTSIVNYSDSYTPDGWHHFAVAWKSGEIALFIDGVRRITITNPNMPSGFAANAYIGSYAGSSYFLNTKHDELRIDKIARTDEEIQAWYKANAPSTPDEYTTYLSHFDGSLSSERVPYACWESAPKDVSQASNKASGKAVITQTLNNGQVALYSASSPTSNGTYSDWALALPDGTLQHPPDNFVKTKLKLTDTDPYTVLLMHMDGSDNGTTFTDECGKTVTAHGDVCTKTAEKKFGTASGYFDGTDDYLQLQHDDFIFASGDITIDGWIHPTTINASEGNVIFNIINNSLNSNLFVSIYSDKKMRFCYRNDAGTDIFNFYSTSEISLNTWTHFACCISGTKAYIFINGELESSVDFSRNGNFTANKVHIGMNVSPAPRCWQGYMDEIRLSKGVARWTSDFTPPTNQYVLNSRPVVHGLDVTFDGAPSATPILDDMSFGAEYMFTTLKDVLVIANGQNAPYKWDGIGTPTLLGGSPPVLDFITTHNNRVWGV